MSRPNPLLLREMGPKHRFTTSNRDIGEVEAGGTLFSSVNRIMTRQPMGQHAQGSITTINVGTEPNRKTFFIHTELLKAKVEYFRGALSNSFRESMSNEVNLTEDNPNAFAIFVGWLYEDFIDVLDNDAEALIETWVLGDKLVCPDLQDEAMAALKRFYRNHPLSCKQVLQVQEHQLDDSILMLFLVQELVERLFANQQGFDTLQASPEFAALKPATSVKIMRGIHRYGTLFPEITSTAPPPCESDKAYYSVDEAEQSGVW